MHHERRVKRENQQDATYLMFIIKLLSQHVSGIIMPIIRRTRVCTAAYGVTSYGFVPLLLQCRTPYATVHNLVLLMMGIMMPAICWDKSLIINIRLVASCWFSLFTLILRMSNSNSFVSIVKTQGARQSTGRIFFIFHSMQNALGPTQPYIP